MKNSDIFQCNFWKVKISQYFLGYLIKPLKRCCLFLSITIIFQNGLIAQNDCDSLTFPNLNLEKDLLLHFDFNNSTANNAPNNIQGEGQGIRFGNNRFSNPNSALDLNDERYIELEHNADLKPDFPFSFAFWVYPREIGRYKNYIYISDFRENNRAGFSIQTAASTNQIHFFIANGCDDESCRLGERTFEPLTKYRWTHVAINAKSATNIDLYLDGCLVESEPTGNGPASLTYSTANSLLGKADPSQVADNQFAYFNGLIDDFYFWNREVSEEEIKYLFDFYNLPTLENMEEEYVLPDNDAALTFQLDHRLLNTTLQENPVNNEFDITEPGTYHVSGQISCHRFCKDFRVIKEAEESRNVVINETEFKLCHGDSLILNQEVIKENTVLADTFRINTELDSIVITRILFEFDDFGTSDTIWLGQGKTYTPTYPLDTEQIAAVRWEPDSEISCNDCLYPVFSPSKEQRYTGHFLTTSGCEIQKAFLFQIITPEAYYVPNTFSPNGDGYNDYFRVYSKFPIEYELQIFSRWGERIYQEKNLNTNSTRSGWDGWSNGQKIPAGVYLYYIIFENSDQEQYNLPPFITGDLTVFE